MAKLKTKSVQIGTDIHKALSDMLEAAGGTTTLRDAVESALSQVYPPLEVFRSRYDSAVAKIPNDKTGNDDDDGGNGTEPSLFDPSVSPAASTESAIMTDILSVVFGGGDPRDLVGSIQGSRRQDIRISDLAAHMQRWMPNVSTLTELIDSYEAAAAGSDAN